MNRLEKKCLIVSVGLHLLLAGLLVIGPAFLPRERPLPPLPLIDFIPLKTTDAMVSGGGNPNARPPPSPPTPKQQPVTQAAAPPPVPSQKEPEPVRERVHEITKADKFEVPKPSSDSLEPSRDRKSRKPDISTKLVTRGSTTRNESKSSADETARAQAIRREHIAREFGQAAQALAGEASSSTKIELPGPGGGGVPYANFKQAIQSVYQRAWRGMVPDSATDRDTIAKADVTVARNGKVLTHRITFPSGNSQVDRAVELTLERVTFAAPLPDESKDDERTVTIQFEAKPRLGTG
jgi:TonB family protein